MVYVTQRFYPVSLYPQIWQKSEKQRHATTRWINLVRALCTSLAARLGSGNGGVALAISAGGPGAVFWMWVTAIIGMATSFAECSRPALQRKDHHGQFRGGPARYMARGLGMRWMGVLFSLFLLVAYGLIFNTVGQILSPMPYAMPSPVRNGSPARG